ncbi:hypothetical protein [Shimia sp. SDUM112013]|uniref:hypothetical protein n=1 Tax=Shimia sp. SDUM112013 TaxID=3136160 RepID=UPI0032ED7EFA
MKFKLLALGGLALALAACAQPEPEPVYIQPSFDKAGNAMCPDGTMVAMTEAGATVCAPVEG